MIVVAILGILAAIVLPELQGHTQLAKESAAKDNLRILRETVGRYTAQNNDVAPGYITPTHDPVAFTVTLQLLDGYISEIPENPFNGLNTFGIILDSDAYHHQQMVQPAGFTNPTHKKYALIIPVSTAKEKLISVTNLLELHRLWIHAK